MAQISVDFYKKVNELNSVDANFSEIRVLAKKEKGNLAEDYLNSSYVPETGIEPAHPCERQILSLLRLPIPPPGLKGCNITPILLIVVQCDASIFS